jgi:hypothetical protein
MYSFLGKSASTARLEQTELAGGRSEPVLVKEFARRN